MKRLKLFALPTLFCSLCFLHPNVIRADSAGQNLVPLKQKMVFVSLENLEAEYYSANKIVAIKGSIKNVSNSSMRGYITLYLLSVSGTVLRAFDLPLNDHRPFGDGESVSFDTAVNVSNVSGAYQVSVEFTRD